MLKTGEGNGTPLQYSCLANPMDGGAWWAAVHGVARSQTWLSDFTFTFHLHALEKEMATHSSVLAWRTPGMGEPGGLPSVGSHRVGHDWSDLAAAAAAADATSLSSTSFPTKSWAPYSFWVLPFRASPSVHSAHKALRIWLMGNLAYDKCFFKRQIWGLPWWSSG